MLYGAGQYRDWSRQDNFSGISKLVFATPDTVTNKRGEEWAAEIRKDSGYDLAIMEREDFVISLMGPAERRMAAVLETRLRQAQAEVMAPIDQRPLIPGHGMV